MKGLRVFAGLLVVSLAAGPAIAQTMNAEAFYRSATELQSKGPLAVFSMGKVRALTAEAQRAGQKALEARMAAKAAGRPPRYCPPEGPRNMSSSEFLTRLAAIPAAQRSKMDMTEATTLILATKFPCGAAHQ